MGDVPVKGRNVATSGDLTIGLGQNTGKMQLEHVPDLRLAGEQHVDRLDEVDMGAAEDVEPGHAAPQGSPQRAPPTVLQAELGVQVTGVHDAELPVLPRRRVRGEVGGVEAVRNRHDRAVGELGERSKRRRTASERAHDDRGRAAK